MNEIYVSIHKETWASHAILYVCMEVFSFLGVILPTLGNSSVVRIYGLNYLILSSFSFNVAAVNGLTM